MDAARLVNQQIRFIIHRYETIYQSTGVSTDAVRSAAEAFLAALTGTQRAAMLFTVDDEEWRKWSNVDGYTRQGVSL